MAIKRGTNVSDRLTGTSADDKLYGLLGNDTLKGGNGDDYLSGNDGNDRLYGDAGEDVLYGGNGVDLLYGGAGIDVLDGGNDRSRDTLDGGAGNDQISVHVYDVVFGGAGKDTLVIQSDFDFANPTTTRYNINLSNIEKASGATFGLTGAKAGGFEQAQVLLFDARAGSVVTGSDGDDVLSVSGEGSVTIKGGTGSDEISGGAFADLLYGGAGADLFVIDSVTPGQPADRIGDFKADDFFLVGNPFFSDPALENVDQANPLRSGSTPVATSTKGQFLYDTDDGRLFYDADGRGAGAAVHIFTLAGKPVLNANDFIFDF